MMLILYPLLAVTGIVFTLISVILVNWWAPLVATPSGRLPIWLAWFDTFDADLDTGNREMGWNQGYWGRVRWLYRNTGYGFDYWALGCAFKSSDWKVVRYAAGDNLFFYARGPSGRFNLHATRWGVRVKLGWKAWNCFDAATGQWRTAPWGPGWRVPFVFTLSKA